MKVLELYCGMGGMHWALKMTSVPYDIVAAVEINPTVLEIYSHNFPDTNVSRRNIESLTIAELNSLKIDMIVMSPPCQPFCRTGLQLDTKDARTSSLVQLCKILPEVDFKYLLVENVQGFENSDARTELLTALSKCGFRWQEFLLTPKKFHIPNSRLRYYLIGKKSNLDWSFDLKEELMTDIPIVESCSNNPAENCNERHGLLKHIVTSQRELWSERRKRWSKQQSLCEFPWVVSDIIEEINSFTQFMVPDTTIEKYGKAMDIVEENSSNTCCFTKGYSHFVKGTGSLLRMKTTDDSAGYENNCLRYFTPKEISRLMCYPEEFTFPENLSLSQCYKALGNSLNVYVVSLLLALLISN